MLQANITSSPHQLLSGDEIRSTLTRALEKQFTRQRLLVLIPDHTRSLPLPFLFRTLVEILHDARQLDFMVALGTHPALSDEHLNQLVGITPAERASLAAGKGFGTSSAGYPFINLLNHAWDDPAALVTLGVMEQDEIRQIAGVHWHESLPNRVEIRLNKAVLEYDHLLILGPTFPHEVVGFSGGAKYLFPGISGPEMINATHWLGALAGVVGTIGVKETPVRAMIHAAARRLKTPVTLIALTVQEHDLAGLFIGEMYAAWSAAADFSSQRHIRWCEKPYWRVLSAAPPMYDELWTAAKAMYKLEPAVALGGEVVIYAPHLSVVSHVHGKYIYEVGYHILDYFLADWQRFKHIPLGVLAHSTHLRGSGVMENGIEKPNVRVTLASQIPPEDCARLNLGYLDPAQIRPAEWEKREDEGILYVPKAGEILYRLK
ncbi:MAG: lactate racemase domain-containing protein [Anaerolineales bacterium]